MNERLKQLRKELKLSQTEFANKIGKTMQTVQNYEYGKSQIDAITMTSICAIFGINSNWLLTGKGDMFAKSPTKDIVYKNAQSLRYYPEVRASAGYGAFNAVEEHIPFALPDEVDADVETDVVINVLGDSMLPTLHNRDKVLLSTAPIMQLDIEKIYAVFINGTLIIKRFAGVNNNSYVFSSDNSSYSNIYLEKDDDKNMIVGTVKGILYRKLL